MPISTKWPTMSEQVPPPKPSALIDHPWFWKALWTLFTVAAAAIFWTGKTAWDANTKLIEIREQVRKDAASDAARELTGYVRTTEFLAWQLAFEREQRARDKEMLSDLQSLQKRLR
jgi:hypothetical protein